MKWYELKALDEKGQAHKKSGFRGPDLQILECPNCHKLRMQRPIGHVINYQKNEITIRGIIRQVYTDVCFACLKKLVRDLEGEMQIHQKEMDKLKGQLEKREDLKNVSLEDLL